MSENLHQRLLKAQAEDDFAELIDLYEQAAQAAELYADMEAACFYRTHAFVFALQVGDLRADDLQYALFLQGRETCPTGYAPIPAGTNTQKAAISGDL